MSMLKLTGILVMGALATQAAEVKLGGYVGKRLDGCLEHNVKATDGIYLTDVFKTKRETNTWQTEFWGKWMHAAVPLYRQTGDAALKANIDASVKNILATQREDGYIGNYTDDAQLNGPWDIWGRKYTMLGLIHYYDLTGDETVLKAACRVADHLMTQVGPGKKELHKVGAYHGMASCSVLEPILWLHTRTKDPRYRQFADYIVSQMEEPEGSAKLISKALAGIDVGSRFPHPKTWWTWENGMKAYEMMSCYQGLLEYYQLTGETRYLDAAVATAQNIIATEINIAGSGAAFECWYHGAARETQPAYHMMETCVTTTWLRLCQTLLHLTGDTQYADHIERTFYNAFLAAISHDHATFSKYCPLEGMRGRGEDQCRMKTNCCIANGPRGFLAFTETLATAPAGADADRLHINLFAPSTVKLALAQSKTPVTIIQETDYPASGTVKITLRPAVPAAFTLRLRIPQWCRSATLALNDAPAAAVLPANGHTELTRIWTTGDTLTLNLDMTPRAVAKDNHFALLYGPILLARDARFNDGNIHEVVAAVDPAKPAPLNPLPPGSGLPPVWLAFSMPLRVGINLESDEGKIPRDIHFCDFASAGDTWKEESLYRVWQRVPLNVTHAPYVPYNPPAQ